MTDSPASDKSSTDTPNVQASSPLADVREAFLEKLSKEESLPEGIRSELAKLLAGGAIPTEAQIRDIITRE
jgi:hypothetical protein